MQHLMRTITAALLYFVLSSASLHSQVTVKGTLKDSSNDKAVPYATVGLYKPGNTNKPIQNIFSDKKGGFEFTKVAKGEYIVIATYTGYREIETRIRVDSIALNVPPIILVPHSLEMGGVMVTAAARKPLIEQEDDKLIFNTESDPSLEGLTAIDVMRKTPFLAVDGDGNVTMNGKSNYKVLLNGKETAMFSRNLTAALKSFPASLIKRVEIITSPSAKYDGEGVGGIINIITQKKVAGYNGSLGVYYGTLNSLNVNGSINIKYGKMGFSAFTGISRSRPPGSRSYSEVESLNPIAYYKRISNGRQVGRNDFRYGSFEWSLDIDSVNSLSVYMDLNGGKNGSVSNSQIDVIAPDRMNTETSLFTSQSRSEFPSINLGSDFVHKSRRHAGQEVTFKLYLENARDRSYSMAEQEIAGADRFVMNDNSSPNRAATFESNFVRPLKKGRKLELGVKGIIRNAESDYLSLLKYNETDEYQSDPKNSNNFEYTQQIYSAYGTYSMKWKEISFRLGSRVEHTEVDGDFRTSNTVVRQSYTTLLPNIYMSRKFKKIHTFSLSYGKRLRRPYIWDLNPFVSNLDSLNIRVGNPNLGPDILHAFELGYTVLKGKTSINTRLIESISNKQIISFTSFDPATGIATSGIANAGQARVTTLSVNISSKLNKDWSFSIGSNVRYTNIRNRFNKAQNNDGFGGYLTLNSSYMITQKWRVSGSAFLSRPDVQLQGQTSSYKSYNLGSSYKLFNNKITLGISASNFFSKYLEISTRTSDVNFIRFSESAQVQRAATISISWNFGKLSENVSRKRGVSNDDIKK